MSSSPLDGPASHVSIPPSDAVTSMIPTSGVSTCQPNCAKTTLNACITPAVRDSSLAGTTQLIASAGRMKISSTNAIAKNIALGNCRAGLRSDETCTAFISIPEYDRKLFTISTRLASPAHCGNRLSDVMGAADACPWPRNTKPRITSTTPGTSVPMIRPPLASPATPFVPRDDTHTPDQYATMITAAVQTPLLARPGLNTYASVLAT